MSLGLNAYHSTGSDFAARVEYNAKAGRMFRVDRQQDSAGNFVNDKVDITMSQPMFAFDSGTIEVGWAFFPPGAAPQIVMVPYGQPMPTRPVGDYKAGFRAKIWNKRDLGDAPREFMSTAGVVVGAVEELWNQIKVAPETAAGQIPVVQLVNVKPVASKHGTNYAPEFKVVKFIPRDEALFGPRTAAADLNGHAHAPPAAPAPKPSNHVPPPAPKPAPAPVAAMPAFDDEVPF